MGIHQKWEISNGKLKIYLPIQINFSQSKKLRNKIPMLYSCKLSMLSYFPVLVCNFKKKKKMAQIFRVYLSYNICSICWINWKQKLKLRTKNQIFVVVVAILTFLYTLKRRTRKLFSPSKEMFSCAPYSKCIKKSLNFHLHQQKMFWF